MKKVIEFILNFLLCLGYVLLTRLVIKLGLEGAISNNLLASVYLLYFCLSLPIFIFLIEILNGITSIGKEIKEVWLFEPEEFQDVEEAYDKCYNNRSGMSKDFNKGYITAVEEILTELSVDYKIKENEEGMFLKILGPKKTEFGGTIGK